MPQIERPDEFAAVVEEFLSRRLAGRQAPSIRDKERVQG